MKAEDKVKAKVHTYMAHLGMLKASDRVIAGVSGGADSVCLLFLLCEYQKQVPFKLRVVHINHGIRVDAAQDAAYVEEICGHLRVPFFQEKIDVKELARSRGLSEEEAGRKARYEAFEKYGRQWIEDADDARVSDVKIAVAHHMGDRAETLLFHLFRGSGSNGLGSIRPMRQQANGFTVIRPLLCLERSEIEEYLRNRGIAFCEDSTNSEDAYVRNRIRHHILPFAEEQICSGAVRHLNSAAENLAQTEDFLCEQTQVAMQKCVCGGQIQVDAFLRQHTLIQKRILFEMLKSMSPSHKDIGAVHVGAVLGLFEGETGKSLDLPFGITAKRSYGKVVFEKQEADEEIAAKESNSAEIILSDRITLNQTQKVDFGPYHFEILLFFKEKKGFPPENKCTKWFDYDKIKDTLLIRTRKSGDYLTIRSADGKTVHKSVKDYMITEKIARDFRDCLPMIADGSHILWIPGYRISEYYKIDENTKHILQVNVTETEDKKWLNM